MALSASPGQLAAVADSVLNAISYRGLRLCIGHLRDFEACAYRLEN